MVKSYVTAIIPAHNEASVIKDCITSLIANGCDEIIVANDNSSDETYKICLESNVTVFNTVNNKGRKAGAINQALKNYLNPNVDSHNHYILIIDADTVISEQWLTKSRNLLDSNKFDAVGSIFHADNNVGYLRYMQYLEWERYASQITGLQKVFVLTGTASLIRLSKLHDVYKKNGFFYNENCITEDFAMTIDLKEVGTRMISPASVNCKTETMPSVKLLFLQRRRWYLGAMQQVFNRKLTKVTLVYLFQQIMLSISVISFSLVLLADGYLLYEHQMNMNLFWLFILFLFIFERVYTVWNLGWKARFTALLLLPELLYAYILQISYVAAMLQFLTRSKGTWNHINDI